MVPFLYLMRPPNRATSIPYGLQPLKHMFYLLDQCRIKLCLTSSALLYNPATIRALTLTEVKSKPLLRGEQWIDFNADTNLELWRLFVVGRMELKHFHMCPNIRSRFCFVLQRAGWCCNCMSRANYPSLADWSLASSSWWWWKFRQKLSSSSGRTKENNNYL